MNYKARLILISALIAVGTAISIAAYDVYPYLRAYHQFERDVKEGSCASWMMAASLMPNSMLVEPGATKSSTTKKQALTAEATGSPRSSARKEWMSVNVCCS